MKREHATLALWLALSLAPAVEMRAEETTAVDYPFLGVTHITRTGSVPDFPRNVKIHVVRIDLTAPHLSFRFTPHSGTRDTHRETTLQYLNDTGAQIAINGCFFGPSDLRLPMEMSIPLSSCRRRTSRSYGMRRPSTSIRITTRASCIAPRRTPMEPATACARRSTDCTFRRTSRCGMPSPDRLRLSPAG